MEIFMSEEKQETLGDRIKQVRGKLGQKEFADLLGIGRSTLIRYENNERMPDADFFIRMHTILHVESSWLLIGEGKKDTGEQMTADEAALLFSYRLLANEEDKRAICRFVDYAPKIKNTKPAEK
jgi:transcriptional regulator with XRE-family HTH domain